MRVDKLRMAMSADRVVCSRSEIVLTRLIDFDE
jgi:hypothetical protein